MSLFSIGLSGLNAAQNALYATSNNISNVYTPGYNRELVLLGERGVGNGVQVNDIQRQFDQYVAGQLNQSTSNASATPIKAAPYFTLLRLSLANTARLPIESGLNARCCYPHMWSPNRYRRRPGEL